MHPFRLRIAGGGGGIGIRLQCIPSNLWLSVDSCEFGGGGVRGVFDWSKARSLQRCSTLFHFLLMIIPRQPGTQGELLESRASPRVSRCWDEREWGGGGGGVTGCLWVEQGSLYPKAACMPPLPTHDHPQAAPNPRGGIGIRVLLCSPCFSAPSTLLSSWGVAGGGEGSLA